MVTINNNSVKHREAVANKFQEIFGNPPSFLARAPGRVNLLGEHIDYNEGIVLPMAIDRETIVAFASSNTDLSSILAADLGEKVIFSSQSLLTKSQIDGSPLPHWALYPAGIAWALANEGLDVPGLQAVFSSTVPAGSGLSSSASIEMAFLTAWQNLAGWMIPSMRRALLGQKAESEYVGVNCGIMDQFASVCGENGKLLVLDCRSLEWETLPFPDDFAVVLADTKVRHELTRGEYNQRRSSCEEALHLLQSHLPEIRALRDVQSDDFNHLAQQLPDILRSRARHVVEEIDRVKRAIPLLKAHNFVEFGQMMNDSHVSLRDLYEVSCPELDLMFQIAQSLDGCLGARLTGAGFGGCTVNLVRQEAVGRFVSALAINYTKEIGIEPEIFVCQPSQGASLS